MLIYRQGGRGRGLSQAKQPVQRHIRQSLADAAAHSLSPTPSIKKKKKSFALLKSYPLLTLTKYI
jgi:hypothetical protein